MNLPEQFLKDIASAFDDYLKIAKSEITKNFKLGLNDIFIHSQSIKLNNKNERIDKLSVYSAISANEGNLTVWNKADTAPVRYSLAAILGDGVIINQVDAHTLNVKVIDSFKFKEKQLQKLNEIKESLKHKFSMWKQSYIKTVNERIKKDNWSTNCKFELENLLTKYNDRFNKTIVNS